jgi:putative transposase
MAKIHRRWDGPGQWYFVTVVTRAREPIFAEAACCLALQQAIKEVRYHHRFRLAGLAILPDHWHALICPEPPIVIETIVGAVKQNLLRKIWVEHKRPTIWQSQFLDRRIRDEDDFMFHLEYIRINAVKHGYVNNPEDYEWFFIHDNPFGKIMER